MNITVHCPNCGQTFTKEFDDEKIKRVQNGELVQEVFPELTPGERELFFITGICDNCWNKMFPDEEPFDYEEEFRNENDMKPLPPDTPEDVGFMFKDKYIPPLKLEKSSDIEPLDYGACISP